jgi:hypothetical protein
MCALEGLPKQKWSAALWQFLALFFALTLAERFASMFLLPYLSSQYNGGQTS